MRLQILQYQAAACPLSQAGWCQCGACPQRASMVITPVTMRDWVEKLSALIKDASLRTRMGQSAIQTIPPFDLDAIGPRLTALITRIIAASKLIHRA